MLAIVIPNDYRQQPVLLDLTARERLVNAVFTADEHRALRSFNEHGGELVKLRVRTR